MNTIRYDTKEEINVD